MGREMGCGGWRLLGRGWVLGGLSWMVVIFT